MRKPACSTAALVTARSMLTGGTSGMVLRGRGSRSSAKPPADSAGGLVVNPSRASLPALRSTDAKPEDPAPTTSVAALPPPATASSATTLAREPKPFSTATTPAAAAAPPAAILGGEIFYAGSGRLRLGGGSAEDGFFRRIGGRYDAGNGARTEDRDLADVREECGHGTPNGDRSMAERFQHKLLPLQSKLTNTECSLWTQVASNWIAKKASSSGVWGSSH